MNLERNNLRHQQRAEQEAQAQFQETHSENQGQEFATVDDLLRYDSGQNPVPAGVADRLNRSLEAEQKPAPPWYKKLFG